MEILLTLVAVAMVALLGAAATAFGLDSRVLTTTKGENDAWI